MIKIKIKKTRFFFFKQLKSIKTCDYSFVPKIGLHVGQLVIKS